MIRHIVLVRFRDDITAEQKAEIFDGLNALRNHLPGIADFRSGPNTSPEHHLVRGFNDLFWFDFEDVNARDTYLDDPEHKAAGARLVSLTEGGRDGICVADIEV